MGEVMKDKKFKPNEANGLAISNPFETSNEEENLAVEMSVFDTSLQRKYPESCVITSMAMKQPWMEILSFLDIYSQLTMRQTHKFFANLYLDSDNYWKDLISKYLTKIPKLKNGETYRRYFLRHMSLLKQLSTTIEDKRKFLYEIAALGLDVVFCSTLGVTTAESYSPDTYFHVAVKTNNTIILEKIISEGGFPLTRVVVTTDIGITRGSYSSGIFETAAEYGSLECLEFLHSKYKIYTPIFGVNDADKNGNSALHYAAKNGHLPCVKFLIENGANINQKNVKLVEPDMNTALHLAAQNGHKDVVHFLIEKGAQLNIANAEGKNPYQIAIEKKQFECAKILESKMQKQGIEVKEFGVLDSLIHSVLK